MPSSKSAVLAKYVVILLSLLGSFLIIILNNNPIKVPKTILIQLSVLAVLIILVTPNPINKENGSKNAEEENNKLSTFFICITYRIKNKTFSV